MDPSVSTSFIPKKNFDTTSNRGSGGAGLVLLLSVLIFIVSLVAAGAAFGYEKLLNQQLAGKSASLALNEKAYDPGVIQELLRVDTRLNETKKMLDKHVAPSAIFGFLGQQTLEKVQFTSFDYDIKLDGSSEIKLHGVADSFSTVALQSDQFGASKILKEVVFSGVSADATGRIGFDVSATIVPTLTLYSNALTADASVPASGVNAPDSSSTPQ